MMKVKQDTKKQKMLHIKNIKIWRYTVRYLGHEYSPFNLLVRQKNP